MGRRLAIAAVLAAVVVPMVMVTAESGPFEPLRRVFKEPVDTLRGLVKPKSRAAPAQPPAAEAPATPTPPTEAGGNVADQGTATVVENPAPVAPGDMPVPRLRPDEESTAPVGPGGVMNAVVQAEAPAPDVSQQHDAIEAMIAARSLGAAYKAANPDAEAIAAGQPLGYATPGDDIAVQPHLRPKAASVTAALDEERGSALAGALRPGGSCSKTLSTLGVIAVSVDPIRSGSCGIPAPVQVAALGGGAVKLSMKAVVNCNIASTLASFMADVVDPLAQQKLGGSVTDIRIAAAYDCRSRNGVAGAKLSEHAKGNAIDISAFKVKGEWIVVGGKNGLAQSAFLREVRKAGCGPFTTVLGPGSDSYHSDHFHFDLAQRGKSGRGLYCH